MGEETLEATARALVAPGKGILAADESTGTIEKRLKSIDVESTEDAGTTGRCSSDPRARRPHLGRHPLRRDDPAVVEGRRAVHEGAPRRRLIPGIKVDMGAKPLAGADGEIVTEGLDGLRERLEEYRELGAKFTKWRAVITIDGDKIPSAYSIHVNSHALARYAVLSQEAGLVRSWSPRC